MSSILPVVFMVVAGVGLLAALVSLWHSARAIAARRSSAAAPGLEPGAERASLLEQKKMLLRSLKDLDLEHDLGKLSDADYERLRKHYRAQARHVLRDLDEQAQPYRKRARRMIEARVERDLGTTANAEPAEGDAHAESHDATFHQGAEDDTATDTRPRCSECRAINDADAAFCKKCGTSLTAPSASASAAERGTA